MTVECLNDAKCIVIIRTDGDPARRALALHACLKKVPACACLRQAGQAGPWAEFNGGGTPAVPLQASPLLEGTRKGSGEQGEAFFAGLSPALSPVERVNK